MLLIIRVFTIVVDPRLIINVGTFVLFGYPTVVFFLNSNLMDDFECV